MANDTYSYKWDELDDSSKESIRTMRAVFILAPRELSRARLLQLIKTYLPQGNIICGIANEQYVDGFMDQPQFRMFTGTVLDELIQKTAKAKAPHKVYRLSYPQAATDDVIRFVRPKIVVVVRGSYQYVFHRRSTYALLKKRDIPFELVSPFADEHEAIAYSEWLEAEFAAAPFILEPGDEAAIFRLVDTAAIHSFDYSFQTGCVVAEPTATGYRPVAVGYNRVIPYQTYALHTGNSREEHLSPAQDANYYDTIHAEMAALVQMNLLRRKLTGKTLFINLLPCPNCARTLSQTGLKEVVYKADHSDGYAAQLFAQCNIKVRKAEVL